MWSWCHRQELSQEPKPMHWHIVLIHQLPNTLVCHPHASVNGHRMQREDGTVQGGIMLLFAYFRHG
jgi:hypothetical protein